MKTIILIIFALFIQAITFAQDKLVKDIDHDHINDTVYVDQGSARIVCRLSSRQFKKTESQPIEILNDQSGINATKSGFEFYNDWMRAGYKNQFRYDSKTKKIQLIGMSRYEFGNAANDGSGESSINLLTNDYIGNWNYADMESGTLAKIPTIKAKMILKKVYLETFSENTYFTYADRCSALYDKYKTLMIKYKK